MSFDTYTVYKHTVKENGKVYIGITARDPKTRWHCDGSGYRYNSDFWNDIQKYGWSNVEHEIIAEHLTKDEACALEIKLISEYNSNDPARGYNHSTGGTHGGSGSTALRGIKRSEETKRKISESISKRYLTEEGQRYCESMRKRVMCIETNTVHNSVTDAAAAYNTSIATVSLICHGMRGKLRGCYSFVLV